MLAGSSAISRSPRRIRDCVVVRRDGAGGAPTCPRRRRSRSRGWSAPAAAPARRRRSPSGVRRRGSSASRRTRTCRARSTCESRLWSARGAWRRAAAPATEQLRPAVHDGSLARQFAPLPIEHAVTKTLGAWRCSPSGPSNPAKPASGNAILAEARFEPFRRWSFSGRSHPARHGSVTRTFGPFVVSGCCRRGRDGRSLSRTRSAAEPPRGDQSAGAAGPDPARRVAERRRRPAR